MAGDGVIQRIRKDIVPFPDIVPVERYKGKIQENYEQDRKNIVHDILRCEFPEFFPEKITRCHQVHLDNGTKNNFPNAPGAKSGPAPGMAAGETAPDNSLQVPIVYIIFRHIPVQDCLSVVLWI